jgi:hypothetical protein
MVDDGMIVLTQFDARSLPHGNVLNPTQPR